MYFQSPRPFGQQSTSFRPVGNSGRGLRAASSLSVLSVPTFDNTGHDLKQNEVPADNLSSYDSSTTFTVNKSDRKGFPVGNEQGNLYFARKDKISSSTDNGLNKISSEADNIMQRSWINNQPLFYTPMAKPKYIFPRKTVSLTDALSDDAQNPSFSGWDNSMGAKQTECREVPILREPLIVSHASKQDGLAAEFQASSYGSCTSEVPFANHGSPIVSPPSRRSSNSILCEEKVKAQLNTPEIKNDNQTFTISTGVPIYSTKITEQSHTFDNSLKIKKTRIPSDVSTDIMLHAALGVRAELEKDPKFRSRADSLKNNRFPVKTSQPGSYKQSPSFLQLQGYLLNSKSVLQPPLISSTFTPEKVRNLFSIPNDDPKSVVNSSVQNFSVEASSQPDQFQKFSQNVIKTSPQMGENVRVLPVVIQNKTSHDGRRGTSVNSLIQDGSNQSPSSTEVAPSALQGYKNSTKRVFTVINETANFSQPRTAVVTVSPNSPPSILVKNSPNCSSENTVKPVKKVVFQCDDLVPNLYSKESLRAQAQEIPLTINQYDEALEDPLSQFVKLSEQVGGDVKEVGELVSTAFSEMRKVIWNASGQAELSATDMTEKLSPISQRIEKIGALTASKRSTPFFNHLSAISDGIPALGWLTVKPTPGPFVKEMRDAAMFYVNRVYKEHREGDKVHTQWAKSWVELLTALEKYVRQAHTTGLVWNSSPGAMYPDSGASGGSGNIPSNGSVPPPVPLIPANLLTSDDTSKKDASADRSALFAEINKGEDITKGLRKVTKDMQTHKNPALRAKGPLKKEPQAKGEATVPGTKKVEVDKPPKLALENGKQWIVEYHKDRQDLVIDITDMKQTVYIYKCINCVVQIKGKLNSVMVDDCKKTSIVFENLLSQIEIINCQSVQIQSLGTMPTVSIQKTDGCQVYMSKESLNAEIVTSKSSTMNLLIPTGEEGDFEEYPLPEQFKTTFDGKKLHTTVSDIV